MICLNLTLILIHSAFLTALPSAASTGWSELLSGSTGAATQFSLFITAAVWRTTHRTVILQALSGVTQSPRRHWKQASSMPMVISALAHVLLQAQDRGMGSVRPALVPPVTKKGDVAHLALGKSSAQCRVMKNPGVMHRPRGTLPPHY